jgi:hypothetical protein
LLAIVGRSLISIRAGARGKPLASHRICLFGYRNLLSELSGHIFRRSRRVLDDRWIVLVGAGIFRSCLLEFFLSDHILLCLVVVRSLCLLVGLHLHALDGRRLRAQRGLLVLRR